MSQDSSGSTSLDGTWNRLKHKFFFKSTPPCGTELSVLRKDIVKHEFFKRIIDSGLNIYQATVSEEVLKYFINHLKGSLLEVDNGFEYIRFGLEIKDRKFVKKCCLNCSSLKIPEGALIESVIKVFTTFVETVPLRDMEDYGIIFEELSTLEDDASALELVDRIYNIIEERKKSEVSVSPVPLFTSRITAAVLRMTPSSELVTAVFFKERWVPSKIFGHILQPGEVGRKFHLVFAKYILIFTEDRKIVKRNRESSTVLLEDVEDCRSHFGRFLVIRKETLFAWNEVLEKFDGIYSNSRNCPKWASAEPFSDEINLFCHEGNLLRIRNHEVISNTKGVHYYDCVADRNLVVTCSEGKSKYESPNGSCDLGDIWTHLGWSDVTVSKNSAGIYETKGVPSWETCLHGDIITASDIFLGC